MCSRARTLVRQLERAPAALGRVFVVLSTGYDPVTASYHRLTDRDKILGKHGVLIDT